MTLRRVWANFSGCIISTSGPSFFLFSHVNILKVLEGLIPRMSGIKREMGIRV